VDISSANVALTDCSQDTHAEIADAPAEVKTEQKQVSSVDEHDSIPASQLQEVVSQGSVPAGAGAGAGAPGAGAGPGVCAGAGAAVAVGIPVGVPPVCSTRQIESKVLIPAAAVGFASTLSKQELQAEALGVIEAHAHASSEHVLAALIRLSHAAAQGS